MSSILFLRDKNRNLKAHVAVSRETGNATSLVNTNALNNITVAQNGSGYTLGETQQIGTTSKVEVTQTDSYVPGTISWTWSEFTGANAGTYRATSPKIDFKGAGYTAVTNITHNVQSPTTGTNARFVVTRLAQALLPSLAFHGVGTDQKANFEGMRVSGGKAEVMRQLYASLKDGIPQIIEDF